MLDWDDLRFFLAVARHRTLAAAAKQLHVTQSTVSRRIASLQDGMGVRLLHRTSDGYALTLAGESIRRHVERVESEALSVERAVAGHDVRLDGVVRVTGSQLITSHLLAPCFAVLHASHPGLLIEAVPNLPDDVLATREADIIVRLRRFETQDLVVRMLGKLAFGLYGCVSYFARYGEPDFHEGCQGHLLTTLLDDQEVSEQAAWLSEHASRARVVLKADSYETQYWAAYCGGGLAVLPSFRANAEPALRRVQVPAPIPAAEIWLGVHRENRHIARIRVVLDCIFAAVERRAHLLNPTEPDVSPTRVVRS